ncbi:TIGR02391 family protein [Acinetobacter courvalinii]|uniref:TIGR02391 family protein n=1 Tax=Acinetobacter courvalinii TaxID=280147 RepID=UPI0021CE347C|nr:TIGR02391 family protein [Acinetobacter courvalinii]MCU4368299.1 TIGR02391 family protein [Acinetobacter courvalinii]MCU4446669.1 TIGR02391 family protein [Acinetobacter courvalinii]
MFKTENYYHLEYIGEADITQTCLISLCNLIQVYPDLNYALLLTNQQTHALILRNSIDSYYIIRSGFSSGYPGEGPKGLATALSLLKKHQIETEEIVVSSKIINKLNRSSLSDVDIDTLFNQKIIRPIRLHDYIYPFKKEVAEAENPKRYYPLELPYSILDDRIFDLALLFKQDPDSALLKAYKRLEDIVRTRTGLSEHSSKLFSQAFLPPKACLTWDLPDNSEIDGRANLFTNTYKAFRNARTHREKDENQIHQFREFLLINELYLLEREAFPIRSEA